jgi:hypothetical protein
MQLHTSRRGQVGLAVDMWVVTQGTLFLPTLFSTVGETVCKWRAAFLPGGGRMIPPLPCRYLNAAIGTRNASVVEERTINYACRVGTEPCTFPNGDQN